MATEIEVIQIEVGGLQGPAGATPQISAEVTALDPGTNPTVTVSGEAETPVLTFGIPMFSVDKADELTAAAASAVAASNSAKASADTASDMAEEAAGYASQAASSAASVKGAAGKLDAAQDVLNALEGKDFSTMATKDYVDEKVDGIDLSSYATQSYVDSAISDAIGALENFDSEEF